MRATFCAALFGLLTLASACGHKPIPASRDRIAIMSALPLFGTTGEIGAVLNGPDRRSPIVRALANDREVKPLDHLDNAALARERVMILAQPRALGGAELVAFDAWVRRGGKAIILADPMLLWPIDLPLGDPRRAPSVTLLDPLLAHWGLTLESPPPGGKPVRIASVGGRDVAVAGAGHWQSDTSACIIGDEGLVAECRIGRGHVTLIADADLLDERLWQETGNDNEDALIALINRVGSR